MKSASLTAVALSLVLAMLISSKALAGMVQGSTTTTSSGSLSRNSCLSGDNTVRPSPYTGGAGVSRVFYPADGSTVTVTTAGAVIKQSPCATPYREGWVNPADLNCINNFSDLSGRIGSGTSNPFVNTNSTCNNQTSTSTTANTATAPVTTTATASTSAPQTVTAAATTTTTGRSATVLPNTGPGDVLAFGGVSAILAGTGHYLFKIRRFR